MLTGFLVGVALAGSLALLLNVLARRWRQVAVSLALAVVFGALAVWQLTRTFQAPPDAASSTGSATGPTTAEAR